MRPSYVIVNTTMRPHQRRAAFILNRWGGLGPATMWMTAGFVAGFFVLVVSLTIANALGWLVMLAGLAICFFTYWFIGRHLLFYLPSRDTLVYTNDHEVIGLDREWLRYIATLPVLGQESEQARRFVAVQALASEEVGSTRSATILNYRRLLQEGKSPYAT